MAKYTRRKDGLYTTRISTGKYDENGKAIVATLYARTIRELEDKVAETKHHVNNGTYADDHGKTFGAYTDSWLEIYKKGVAPKAYQKYEWILSRKIPELRPLRLREVERMDVQDAINAADGHPDTQRMILLTVKAVLESAVEDGLIYKNVARKMKQKPHNAREKRPLTELEKKALRTADFTEMERAFVTILYSFGLRSGEALGLMKSDINFRDRTISVRRTVDFSSGISQTKIPKSAAGVRTVEGPESAFKALKPFVENLSTPYLFTGRNGSLISHASYKRFWSGIYRKINDITRCEDMEPMKLTPHIFRHNYATELFYAGISVKEAQRLLGHSSITVTLEIYTHLTPREETRKKLESLAI